MIKSRIFKCVVLITGCKLLIGCAQFVPPTGGKKDETPPKLISSIPKAEQKNYKEKTISLEFDELVDVTSLRQELLIIPEAEGTYDIRSKSNTVILKFDKAFKDSTTYTLNFRKGIKDLNERNESRNLKLVFSTGRSIDSLKIGGNVKGLLSNQPILEAHVALYKLQDSLDLKKTKPDYFIKTDSAGNYQFENLKSGKYRIYAFMDKNSNLKYDTKTEAIGFRNDTINLNKNLSGINILMANSNNEKPKNQKVLPRAEDYTILYDKNIKSFEVKFENKNDSIPYYGEGKELKFYNSTQRTDTLKVNITVADSSGNTLTYLQKIKFRDAEKKKKEKREYLTLTVKPKAGEELDKKVKYEISFDTPILNFDMNKFKILSDTIREEKLETSNFTWNKSKTKLIINKEIKAEREIKIEMGRGVFINIKGDSSDKQNLRYPIIKSENYGLIEGSFEEKKTTKIIQIINDKYEVIAEQTAKDKFLFINVKPGIYLLRIIKDENENGYWDTGNVEKNIQPEEVQFYEEPIRLKANFEVRGLVIK
ncbi:MAG: Ig-like domain-containing protein [Emticicia sp.]|uniref:Ig-like domain-containing protein n=1 Tax=Emticicia sp. TaxID=1930953 RepID=UPI003BA4AA8E